MITKKKSRENDIADSGKSNENQRAQHQYVSQPPKTNSRRNKRRDDDEWER